MRKISVYNNTTSCLQHVIAEFFTTKTTNIDVYFWKGLPYFYFFPNLLRRLKHFILWICYCKFLGGSSVFNWYTGKIKPYQLLLTVVSHSNKSTLSIRSISFFPGWIMKLDMLMRPVWVSSLKVKKKNSLLRLMDYPKDWHVAEFFKCQQHKQNSIVLSWAQKEKNLFFNMGEQMF